MNKSAVTDPRRLAFLFLSVSAGHLLSLHYFAPPMSGLWWSTFFNSLNVVVFAPRNDLIHLQQKRLPTCSVAKSFESITGERLLTDCHGLRAASIDELYYNRSVNKSEFP